MKVNVSYINSLYDYEKTIKMIDASIADGIHADFMDGVYAGEKNFDIQTIKNLFKGIKKDIDVHLMLYNPSFYFDVLSNINTKCVYVHPSTSSNIVADLKKLDALKIEKGIVINPDEDIDTFEELYSQVDRVLLMSVVPGKGGQKFLEKTENRLLKLKKYKEKYNFLIYIDGGINDETIKKVSLADGVISGSFICKSVDYNKQIAKLKT